IMETWQKAGVPLEAALKGIDRSFESYQRSKRGAGKPLKSLAYCTDAVLEATEEQKEAGAGGQLAGDHSKTKEPFSRAELKSYLHRNAEKLRASPEMSRPADLTAFLKATAEKLSTVETLLETPGMLDLEDIERKLSILDEKIHVALWTHVSEDLMHKIK